MDTSLCYSACFTLDAYLVPVHHFNYINYFCINTFVYLCLHFENEIYIIDVYVVCIGSLLLIST